jgi:hypothetical protein
MVDVGLGGCAVRGESVATGTHVAVFASVDLVIVGRAIPPTPGEDVTRLEWAVDADDAAALTSMFGLP